mmetsp:Transcript_58996/g.169382  ORF Transcript_58996/g.169382 Transcript_58996/m.169382 type:complete len:243 (-) Transcript_58996:868-1596(-)
MMMQNIMVIARAPITSASGAFSLNAARVFQTMALYNIQAKDMAVARWQILPDRPPPPLRERTYRMTAKSAIKAVIVPAKKGIARSSSACVKCPLRTGISPVLQNMMAWLVRKPMTTMAPSSSASSTNMPQSGNSGPLGPASAPSAPLPKLMHERSAGRSSRSGLSGAPQGLSGGLPNISLRAPLEAQRYTANVIHATATMRKAVMPRICSGESIVPWMNIADSKTAWRWMCRKVKMPNMAVT